MNEEMENIDYSDELSIDFEVNQRGLSSQTLVQRVEDINIEDNEEEEAMSYDEDSDQMAIDRSQGSIGNHFQSNSETVINLSDTESEPKPSKDVVKKTDVKVKRRRTTQRIEYKLEIIDYMKNHLKADGTPNFNRTSIKKKIPRRTLQGWWKQEPEFRAMLKKRSFNIRKRRSIERIGVPYFPKVDTLVLEWFKDRRGKGLSVTTNDLTFEAGAVYQQLKREGVKMRGEFKASNGWLRGFVKRNRLSSKTATSVGQKVPANAKEMILEFFERVNKFRAQVPKNQMVGQIMNMDEMPVYFDSPILKT